MPDKWKSLIFILISLILAGRFAARYGVGEAREEAADFPSYYYASVLAFDLDTEPYSSASWNAAKPLYQQSEVELFPFLYPPPSLPFFRLFNLFEFEFAKVLMLALNHSLVYVFWALLFFKILEFKTSSIVPLAGLVYLYSFFPLLLNIFNGQVNMIILAITCLSWLAIRDNRHPLWIGLLLAVIVILKLYPVLFLLILFFRKDYKSIVYTLVILLVVSLASTIVLPDGTWQSYYEHVLSQGYMKDVNGLELGRPGSLSINAFLMRMFFGLNIRFDPILTPPAWVIQLSPYLLCGAIGIVSLAGTWMATKKQSDDISLQYCIWLLAIFMVAPVTWEYMLVWILPAIFVALVKTYNRRWFAAFPILGFIAYFLAINFNANNPAFREGWKVLFISSKLYAVGLLWLYFILLSVVKPGASLKKEKGAEKLGYAE